MMTATGTVYTRNAHRIIHVAGVAVLVFTGAAATGTVPIEFTYSNIAPIRIAVDPAAIPSRRDYGHSCYVSREPRTIECRRPNGDIYYRPIAETFNDSHGALMYALYRSDGSILKAHRQRGPLARRAFSHPLRMLLDKKVTA